MGAFSYEKNDFFTENVDALTCLIFLEFAMDGEKSSLANCDVLGEPSDE